MSMNAIFVQVEDAEIARFEADPDSVEGLFAEQTLPAAGVRVDAFAPARAAPAAARSEYRPHHRGDGSGRGW